jgi:hypothetical protein
MNENEENERKYMNTEKIKVRLTTASMPTSPAAAPELSEEQ